MTEADKFIKASYSGYKTHLLFFIMGKTEQHIIGEVGTRMFQLFRTWASSRHPCTSRA